MLSVSYNLQFLLCLGIESYWNEFMKPLLYLCIKIRISFQTPSNLKLIEIALHRCKCLEINTQDNENHWEENTEWPYF